MACEAGLALKAKVTARSNGTVARAAFTRMLQCFSFCLRNVSLDACLGLLKTRAGSFKDKVL